MDLWTTKEQVAHKLHRLCQGEAASLIPSGLPAIHPSHSSFKGQGIGLEILCECAILFGKIFT
jgi:hypothetical protein